jgi:hypothetical protein
MVNARGRLHGGMTVVSGCTENPASCSVDVLQLIAKGGHMVAGNLMYDEICLQISLAQESDADGGWTYDPEFLLNISHQTCASAWDVSMEEVEAVLKVLVRFSRCEKYKMKKTHDE